MSLFGEDCVKRLSSDHQPWFVWNEDWFAVVIAAVLIFLAALGILGENGISIHF